MKIDPRANSSQEVTPVTADSTRPSAKPLEADTDGVKLSDALRLADEAVRAAAISGDLRPAAVARARQLLLTGELGRDLDRLADRIIDSLIQSRVDRT